MRRQSKIVRPHQLSQREWDVAGLSQLRMATSAFPKSPPPGLWRVTPSTRSDRGDEAAWISILNTGDFGTWDRHCFDQMLAGERAPLPLDSIVFATEADDDGVPVVVWMRLNFNKRNHPSHVSIFPGFTLFLPLPLFCIEFSS